MADEDKIETEDEKNVTYEESDDERGIKEKIDKLRNKLKECAEEKQRNLAGWQRAQADFINYRRRQEEQTAEWSRTFGEGLIRDILPVLDSLDAAIAARPDDQGLLTLKGQLWSVLEKHGLQEMKTIGEKFDPQYHEVVECEECSPEEKRGEEIISGGIQKGYMLNGKVLRAAKVKVRK